MSVRIRSICTVKYGHFNDFLQACHEMDDICRARGWVVPTYWAPATGTMNEIIAEYEYADYAAMQRETEASQRDAEFMKIFRGTAELIYPQSARSELVESVAGLLA